MAALLKTPPPPAADKSTRKRQKGKPKGEEETMSRQPINWTRVFVLLGLLAVLALFGAYSGRGTPTAGEQVVRVGLPTG